VRHLFWLLLAVAPAFAQTYPEKAVTIVVNFSAGGPLDAVARIIAEKAAADFKQPVLVENKPGAGGNIGAARRGEGEARRLHAAAVARHAAAVKARTAKEGARWSAVIKTAGIKPD
jgi:tripartite-type tricarboxylate transporter receptor subunit TctC